MGFPRVEIFLAAAGRKAVACHRFALPFQRNNRAAVSQQWLCLNLQSIKTYIFRKKRFFQGKFLFISRHLTQRIKIGGIVTFHEKFSIRLPNVDI